MEKTRAIIAAFCDAPETWTRDELRTLEKLTGRKVSRDDLRTAHAIEKSALYQHAKKAERDAIQAARGAEFAERLRLLINEILPAVETETAQRARLEKLFKDTPYNVDKCPIDSATGAGMLGHDDGAKSAPRRAEAPHDGTTDAARSRGRYNTPGAVDPPGHFLH